jgi:hypothetical protein
MFSLQTRRKQLIEEIEQFYCGHYLAHAVLVPSSRFGLYALAKEVFQPDDSVLISPVTCHTVIQALIAASVEPVFVNIELETGNIDISKLSSDILRSAKGIISTNLYGNPDGANELQRLAREHELFFIEDCAHVLRTTLNDQLIGSFGDASSFSFKKYFGELGGMVTLRDPELADRVRNRINRETVQTSAKQDRLRFAHYQVMRSPLSPLASVALASYRQLRSKRLAHLPAAEEGAGDDCYSGIDSLHKTFPTTAALANVAHSLSHFDSLVSERKRRAEELICECPLSLRRSQRSNDVCYLSVPFFSSRREEVIEAANVQGIPCYFTYRVPMNRWLNDASSSRYLDQMLVQRWCEQILPIDTRYGSQFLSILASQPVLSTKAF